MGIRLFLGAMALNFCYQNFRGIRDGSIRKHIQESHGKTRLIGKEAVQMDWVYIRLGIGGLCMLVYVF